MSELLRVRVAAKRFGTTAVLRHIDLSVDEGEIVALVGPSGCGKSTLLRIIAGLDRDYDGEVVFAGLRQSGLNREIGFVFQEPRLFPWLDVAANVGFGAGSANPSRVSALLAEVGLAGRERALPKELSGGQAQRASIARSLNTQPRLLLLDEPFSAVDAFTRMKLQDLLVSVARQHAITLILVTHDVDEALFLADRVVTMGAHPGVVRDTLKVGLSRPRDRRDPELARMKSGVLTELYAAHAI
ncbi:ABC transporter ATP-binding protein [Ancylobacter sp.]|uniref:ABC transporter ATP-binding protein n=1 Tax=Ancylobacter sp. TaxID=1872567 RepID=UPI003C7BEEE9